MDQKKRRRTFYSIPKEKKTSIYGEKTKKHPNPKIIMSRPKRHDNSVSYNSGIKQV